MRVQTAAPASIARRARLAVLALPLMISTVAPAAEPPAPAPKIDFNREIRPILSNACFTCHGPDAKKRKGVGKPLRLDTAAGATADLNGVVAIVPGKPEESEAIARMTSDDPAERMPPPGHGRALSPAEVDRLTAWVKQGAPYAAHWSYVRPTRPAPPEVRDMGWPRNAIDHFILARLEQDAMTPSPEADRVTLIRRLSLDLIGLPPTLAEVDAFANDPAPNAYERLVDRLLAKPAYGEHWGKLWLDLARYADSAGYADDPARTIWAYRDYVIRSFNANKLFDQFTLEQLAGDLLPGAGDDARIATAFHRNTLTNNEGGTSDEEFRNVAVVDRVNTTMAVWMGTTMACAQCHDHKFDPLTQEEYFKVFAFFNNTEDADRTDESPVLALDNDAQKARKSALRDEIARLETVLQTPSPALLASQDRWDEGFAAGPSWTTLKPASASARSGAKLTIGDDHSIRAELKATTDIDTVRLPLAGKRLTAIRLDALADDALPGRGPGHAGGNFVVSRVLAAIAAPETKRPAGRYLRVELPGKGKILSLAEVQIFRGSENLARSGEASQSSIAFEGPARLAIDGNTDGRYDEVKSTTHTDSSDDPWWELDLKTSQPVDRVVVWNRTDNNLHTRLRNFRVILLDESRKPVWTQDVAAAPKPSGTYLVGGPREVAFAAAFADYAQGGFEPAGLLATDPKGANNRGWAVGGQTGRDHALTLIPQAPVEFEPGSVLTLTIEHLSKHENHNLGRFRVAVSDDDRAIESARTPAAILAILKTPRDRRAEAERVELSRHYRAVVAPELKEPRDRLTGARAELAGMKPETTVPILREMAAGARRATRIQRRGNFLDLGAEVAAGVPTAFPPLPSDARRDRLALAHWLVSGDNPLTPRVIANRYWEHVFGVGIVATSEEFGAQGDLPSHPELLDWLASELVGDGWDLKRFLKHLVTSATYRQSSKVTPESIQRDPENRLLARGPRFRLSAETIRDQALFVSGLLSPKMYGPPVKPPQPALGLSAAFGSGVDWQTSPGEDKHRRGLYTTWRRSSPYPSMTTFDAPNREVCTLRRTRTNTPLQALVTLNDPVYVEAAQALARVMASRGETTEDKARLGFRLCLARAPNEQELARLTRLHQTAREAFALDRAKAETFATSPLGPLPKGADAVDLAAWTVVGNVLLNLDEMFMKR